MKILITGASGFLGSHLCDFYLKKNFNVIGIDNLITGNIENLNDAFKHSNFKFINQDITDKIFIKEKINYILHFASPASPIDYMKYPIETLKVGSTGTQNVINLALKHKAKILFASTSEVYGDPAEHPQSETYYGNVNPIGPRSVYDEAKRYSEALLTAYHKEKKLDIGIVRIFNTYGPRMRVNDGRAIPNFIFQALNNKNFTVYGDGEQTRSFCYVDDIIIAINKVLHTNYTLPINIGNPTEYKILELIEIIKSLTNTNSKIEFGKAIDDDPKTRKPNIALAKKVLNWSPKVDLLEGLKIVINDFDGNS